MSTNVEITAVVETERVRWDDTAIFSARSQTANDEIDSTFSIKAVAPEGEIESGLTYRFFGHWGTYKNKHSGKTERQFIAKTFIRAQPFDQTGIVSYLKRAGVGNGMGPVRVRECWDAWGSDAVRICREQPEIVAERIGIKLEQAERIADFLQIDAGIEATTIDLLSLFDRRGFPKRLVREVVQVFGNKAKTIIERNPYVLMKFSGVGFNRADQLYLSLGLPPGRLKRQALCAWHEVSKDSSGHTWFPIERVVAAINGAVAGATPDPVKALKLCKRARLLVFKKSGDAHFAAITKHAKAEERIANNFQRLEVHSPSPWPVAAGELPVSDHQKDQLFGPLGYAVSMLLGGPGTGKTYTSAALIRALEKRVGIDKVAVCAPTGKAAVRLTQAMRDNKISINAQTIHSMLKVMNVKGGGFEFQYNRENPLPFSFVICDESSMIDTNLMADLIEAIPSGGKLLLVGDPNQLPPVGHGAPLRDFVSAGVIHGELTEIRRNSGRIVQACHEIRQGVGFDTSDPFDPDAEFPENLRMVTAFDDTSKIASMFRVLDVIRHKGKDPVWDCQVIAAVNERGDLSRKRLNRILQAALNDQPEVSGSPFKVGDKVVCLKNAEHERADQGGTKYVANGEQGRVIECGLKLMIVKLIDDVTVKVPRGSVDKSGEGSGPNGSGNESIEAADTGCNWDLAYAVSCHKSQGSEWPFVIVMLDDSGAAKQVCSREWIYTAISRAKTGCFLVGTYQAALMMSKRVALDKRLTMLSGLMKEKLSELVPF